MSEPVQVNDLGSAAATPDNRALSAVVIIDQVAMVESCRAHRALMAGACELAVFEGRRFIVNLGSWRSCGPHAPGL